MWPSQGCTSRSDENSLRATALHATARPNVAVAPEPAQQLLYLRPMGSRRPAAPGVWQLCRTWKDVRGFLASLRGAASLVVYSATSARRTPAWTEARDRSVD